MKLIYNNKKVTLYPGLYPQGFNLAVEMKIGRDRFFLTVNLEPDLKKNRAFLGTNSSYCTKELVAWLEEQDIAKPTGKKVKSGFCEYSEYAFNEKVLKAYSTKEYVKYLEDKMFLYPQCRSCKKEYEIEITRKQNQEYEEYLHGAPYLIQKIFPNLDCSTRGLLARGQNLCQECWEKLFGLGN